MRRLTTIAATPALVAVAGRGPTDSGSLGARPTGAPRSPTASATPEPSPARTAQPTESAQNTNTIPSQTWFTRANAVVPAQRIRPTTQSTSRLALTELLAGPTAVEAGLGIGSAIQPGTTFDIRGIADGVAI